MIEIYGHLYKFLDDGTTLPDAGVVEFAPYKRAAFTLVDTEWVEESDLPRRAEADEHGKWTQKLPTIAESNFTDQRWIITLPDENRWIGTVPATGGPFTLKQLVDDHGWAPLDPADPEAITTIQAYSTVKDDTVSKTQRNVLTFKAGFIVTDNPTTGETEVDVDQSAEVTPAAVVTALASAATPVAFNNKKLSLVATGVAGTDAVNKTQMDAADAAAITTAEGAAATDATTKANAAQANAIAAIPALSSTTPAAVAAAGAVGVGATTARGDHAHAHGDQLGGSLHANAGAAAGFMSAADKTKLDGVAAGAAVASVSGTAPIVSSGGATPAISITAASGSVPGSMSAADKTKLDTVSANAAVASVSGTAPIVSSGGATPAISIAAASTSVPGSMSAADKTKLDGIASGAQVCSEANVRTALAALTAAPDFNAKKLSNVADPASAQDVVTKAYGDANYTGGGGGFPNPADDNLDMAGFNIFGAGDLGADTLTLTSGYGFDISGNLSFNSVGSPGVAGAASMYIDGDYNSIEGAFTTFAGMALRDNNLTFASGCSINCTGAPAAIVISGPNPVDPGDGGVVIEGNSGGKVAFFGGTPVVKQACGAWTNSITSGGTDGTATNWTNLTVYATDAAAIRNAVYQCARQIGLLTAVVRNTNIAG